MKRIIASLLPLMAVLLTATNLMAASAAKPKVSITSPKSKAKWTNTVITVTGKASAKAGVTAVWVQINDGGWVAASTGNGYANWSVTDLPVVAGANLVQACVVDANTISVTNSITFSGILAPASLSGYAMTLKVGNGQHNRLITWGDDTWGQVGLGGDNNLDSFCAGSYSYTVTGPNTAVISSEDIGMMSWLGTINDVTVHLTFTGLTSGTIAWTKDDSSGGGSGDVSFSQVNNLVPDSLAGRTVQVYAKKKLIDTMAFYNDGTFTSINLTGPDSSGYYEFTQYSPTVAIIHRIYTNPLDAGSEDYIELNFTSATGGTGVDSYYNNPTYGSNPSNSGFGTFKLQ